MQAGELLVGLVFDQFEKLGVLAEELLAQVRAALGLEGLEVAVDALFHALQQQPRWSRANSSSQSEPQITLITFQPAPRKRPRAHR